MITIELKELSPTHNYKRTIEAMLSIPFDPQAGWRGDEILVTRPLLLKVQAAEGSVDLTDQEHDEICRRLFNGRYQDASELTHQMLEDICNATR